MRDTLVIRSLPQAFEVIKDESYCWRQELDELIRMGIAVGGNLQIRIH
jgi:hypothetical protein